MSNRLLFSGPTSLDGHGLSLGRISSGRGLSWTDVRAAWRRYRTRQRIADLDSHLLKDIGVTSAEAEMEANKPFWCL
jgi:uncharacterized protein YjiS (DUF1127 family)